MYFSSNLSETNIDSRNNFNNLVTLVVIQADINNCSHEFWVRIKSFIFKASICWNLALNFLCDVYSAQRKGENGRKAVKHSNRFCMFSLLREYLTLWKPPVWFILSLQKCVVDFGIWKYSKKYLENPITDCISEIFAFDLDRWLKGLKLEMIVPAVDTT